MRQQNLHVSVNPDLCVGNGMCRAIAPRTFIADEHEQSVAVAPPLDTREQLLAAARACPVSAITLRDAETGVEIHD